MQFDRLAFSGHAIKRMFERGIQTDHVRQVAESGEIIADYPDDTPYPTRLVLGYAAGCPLHLVAALDNTAGVCYIITAYVPDPGRWSADFRTRRVR